MFSIFNIKKKKCYNQLNVLEHTPASSSDNNIIYDVPVNDELDLGTLSSGPRQPILKVDF